MTNFIMILVSFIFGLSVLNWLLEILKWQILVSTQIKLSFKAAAQQSLGALTVSLITPNRLGDYAAKALFYDLNKTKVIVGLNALGNGTQLIVTIIFGFIGLFYMFYNFNIDAYFGLNYYLLFGIGLLFILIYKKGIDLLKRLFKFYTSLSKTIYTKTLTISVLRYIVFSHQYYLLLVLLYLLITYFPTMMAISIMYLLASVIPGFALVDWVIKGSVAVFIFGYLQFDALPILGVSLLMWLLNFALPAIVGSIYVVRFKHKIVQPIVEPS